MSRRAFSVAVFLINNREVLLIKHKRLGLWLPVGGELELKFVHDLVVVDGKARRETGDVHLETPHEAARREVREETGHTDVEFLGLEDRLAGEPAGFLGYEEHPCGSKGTHLNFNFAARIKSREIIGDGSFTDTRWLSWSNMRAFQEEESSTSSVIDCVCRALNMDCDYS